MMRSHLSDAAFDRIRRVALAPDDWEITELALEMGWITEDQVTRCLEEQEKGECDGTRLPLRVLLVVRRLITGEQLVELSRMRRERSEKGGEAAPDKPAGDLRRIGRFEVIRSIGTGGMAFVYLARDPHLRRNVALKVIRTELEGDNFERFGREAITAAKLRHPGIVAVHEVGMDEGRFFFAMDYHAGGTFRDLISSSLPLRTKIERFREAVVAVAHAHSLGVIHRDLKPANILLDENGRPVIADFGLAHVRGTSHRLTTPGALIGTVAYMSPEQSRGQEADERTDVYSLGVILYEILTGRIPFEGSQLALMITMIQDTEPAPPRKNRSQIPADLEVICLKAMEKDPARRYARAADLAQDLRLYLDGEAILARRPTVATRVLRRMRKRAPLLLVAGALLAAATTLVIYFWTAKSKLGVAVVQAGKREEHAREEARRRETALDLLKEAGNRLERVSNKHRYRRGSANIAEMHREIDEARSLLDRAEPELPDHPDIPCFRARCLEMKGDYAAALNQFAESLRRRPDHGDSLLARARMRLEWRGLWG